LLIIMQRALPFAALVLATHASEHHVMDADEDATMLQAHKIVNIRDNSSLLEAPCTLKGTWSPEDDVPEVPDEEEFRKALSQLQVGKVVRKVREMLTANYPCWPSDDGSYGPLMVRLAWHCSGTFRNTDGLGGCAGGRLRFHPEATWGDNANLDKARSFLVDIKNEFGDGLSWGDLFVLAGTVAISEMGGPTNEFCFGRIDDDSGSKSQMLNCDPNPENQGKPCVDLVPGWPHGQDVAGNIYVNPQGPRGDPNPYLSAQDVERTFGRMGMSFRQTTALIGGGHAFGRAHGNLEGVKTSGFEGKWTTNPTQWDNEYFKSLIQENWEPHEIATGNVQWRTVDRESEFKDTMMLTSDVALKAHPQYAEHAKRFAEDQELLDQAFRDAWWTLTTNGKGWVERRRCIRLEDFDDSPRRGNAQK